MSGSESNDRNRLTTGHLLLWMLGTAIVLACYRAFDQLAVERSGLGLMRSAYAIGFGLTLGMTVAGALLWMVRAVGSRGGFPTQPGHWLLMVRGVATLVSLTGWSIRSAWGQQISEIVVEGRPVVWMPVLLMVLLQYFPSSLAGALGYWAALRSRSVDSGLWRCAIGGLFAYTAFNAVTSGSGLLLWLMEGQHEPAPGFTYLSIKYSGLLVPAMSLLVVVAVIRDPRNRERDFLHWAGIVSLLANAALQVSFGMAIRYFAGL